MAALVLTGATQMPALAATVPDFTQYGFPTVVASQSIAAGQAATIQYNGITITVPAGAFTDPVTFDLLEGPISNFVDMAPSGTAPAIDFAFKVVDQTTGQLVGAFSKPVEFSVTSTAITSQSQYYDISTTGAYTLNPVPATISGDTLSHAIAGAPVGWVITDPAPPAPDFTQHGFPTVVASTSFTPGQAATVSYNGISVAIPGTTFTAPVTFQLLEGPLSAFSAKAPAGQTPVADFAFRVINPATGALIGTFNGAVKATVTNSQINQHSLYEDISTTGAYSTNPIAPTISGDVLTHPIKAATVGWVVTSPTVPAATSPVTGLPIAPVVAVGAGLMGLGSVLYWRQRSAK